MASMSARKVIFTVGFLVLFFSFVGCEDTSQQKDVTVTELHELLQNEDIIVLDVRTPQEIADGKITSTALEADFFEENFIEQATAKIPKDTDVYVYCRGGNRSAKAVIKLRELGYDKTHNVEGGIKAWMAEGYKLEKP
ncbi:rhodanese-related sulfurtransferase [Kordia periserrulae]|uniref:Rhodanese-related sulfurtransferase n=1 Tax=Kordia periserrulae TaxID=701523 RepID=A0A2T6C539_9FLAO|nr:rhodanese-like domain-containing protein [Kordia periserrulae]PTX63429.1 rhodanese-related sulfurtransferase [Kordia periserrulae]